MRRTVTRQGSVGKSRLYAGLAAALQANSPGDWNLLFIETAIVPPKTIAATDSQDGKRIGRGLHEVPGRHQPIYACRRPFARQRIIGGAEQAIPKRKDNAEVLFEVRDLNEIGRAHV